MRQRLHEMRADDDPATERAQAAAATARCRSHDDDRVARVVVEVRRRRAAAGRRRPLVLHARVGSEDDGEAGAADAQRPLDVLDVREQLLVEQARLLDRGARNGHRGAVDAVDVVQADRLTQRPYDAAAPSSRAAR